MSEVTQELLGKDYRYVTSRYGFGLSLDGPAQLEEVVARYRKALRYLYVHAHTKGGPRQKECLDFGLLTLRWSRFLRQAVKVDLMTKRMIHHEDTQAVHG